MILYLGIDPSRFYSQKNLIHYPVIRTEKIVSHQLKKAKELWPKFTHVIFTSRTAARYWLEEDLPIHPTVIAVGKSTASLLEQAGCSPLIAEEETQEGVIELLQSIQLDDAFIFWPKSKQARPILSHYLRGENRIILDLYSTVLQKLEPVPKLDDVEEIVFTSPSTVRGFMGIYKSLPKRVKLTAIGPITQKELNRFIILNFLSL